jgi:spore coat protein U-like protein
MSISRYSVLTAALIGSTLALSSTLISKPAFAAPANTSNIQVSATVPSVCTILTESDLVFGTYDGTLKTTLGKLSTACTPGLAPVITLDQGLNPDGGSTDAVPQRRLKSGSDYLWYNIFQDGGYTTIWGNTAGTGRSFAASGGNAIIVYGTIPGDQAAPAGSYTDTVVATINY